ncbi:MAG: GMC family oxidoreductase, partial [Granulosicoccaceae bacterium]
MSESFDFVVVGAGSAGCVLANRLSENGKFSVCLLEAGGTDWRFFVQVPIGYGKTYYQRAVNWMFHTEPEPGLNQRPSYWPRGKVLGGSSAINAMVYIRGHRQDYDDWAAAGNPGWSYADVLPYFKKSEGNPQGDATFHGREGPLRIDDQREQLHPLIKHFVAAGVELGLPASDDFNGPHQTGVGAYQATIHRGRRMSTARAFLHPAKRRPNLTVVTHAHASRILFEGKRAVGVEYRRRGKTQR